MANSPEFKAMYEQVYRQELEERKRIQQALEEKEREYQEALKRIKEREK